MLTGILAIAATVISLGIICQDHCAYRKKAAVQGR
ncbi:Hypothetical protein DEACI_0282 [Acididesulfobacillus acetoxydans]|uniref:Uncharacterized protein n=1 Tax=Acididesulfobacillus acetoxydans TaxID=1561005 RepID=A0A8S0XAB4_9FIRM|nr:Hypothetical protein DEACI_0282 [Acididesulfobacillus acetoxydans]CEJ06208.1 Hypothetical protein DEACI_0655 [Acididesulfobacillus acetoxydans]